MTNRIAGDTDVLMALLGGYDRYMRAYLEIGKADSQAADLMKKVAETLQDSLALNVRQQEALSRLRYAVDNAGHSDAGLIRNNVFKAANSLGLKLPSYMFASVDEALVRLAKIASERS